MQRGQSSSAPRQLPVLKLRPSKHPAVKSRIGAECPMEDKDLPVDFISAGNGETLSKATSQHSPLVKHMASHQPSAKPGMTGQLSKANRDSATDHDMAKRETLSKTSSLEPCGVGGPFQRPSARSRAGHLKVNKSQHLPKYVELHQQKTGSWDRYVVGRFMQQPSPRARLAEQLPKKSKSIPIVCSRDAGTDTMDLDGDDEEYAAENLDGRSKADVLPSAILEGLGRENMPVEVLSWQDAIEFGQRSSCNAHPNLDAPMKPGCPQHTQVS